MSGVTNKLVSIVTKPATPTPIHVVVGIFAIVSGGASGISGSSESPTHNSAGNPASNDNTTRNKMCRPKSRMREPKPFTILLLRPSEPSASLPSPTMATGCTLQPNPKCSAKAPNNKLSGKQHASETMSVVCVSRFKLFWIRRALVRPDKIAPSIANMAGNNNTVSTS